MGDGRRQGFVAKRLAANLHEAHGNSTNGREGCVRDQTEFPVNDKSGCEPINPDEEIESGEAESIKGREDFFFLRILSAKMQVGLEKKEVDGGHVVGGNAGFFGARI